MVDLWKAWFWDPMVDVALADLYIVAPLFLPFRWLINPIAKFFMDKFYKLFRLVINVDLVIPLRNVEHQRAYELASIQVFEIQKTMGINSPEYKKAVYDNAQNLSTFIAFRT